MDLEIVKTKVKQALDGLYNETNFDFLIKKGLCERCLNHRLAVSLEKQDFVGYFIDCEYNRSSVGLKAVSNSRGNYIDILITKRDHDPINDLACFETKKWNNYQNRKKDRKNLKILTDGTSYNHKIGFYIIYGNTRSTTKVEIYKRGQLTTEVL